MRRHRVHIKKSHNLEDVETMRETFARQEPADLETAPADKELTA
jgi:hypothetical protein